MPHIVPTRVRSCPVGTWVSLGIRLREARPDSGYRKSYTRAMAAGGKPLTYLVTMLNAASSGSIALSMQTVAACKAAFAGRGPDQLLLIRPMYTKFGRVRCILEAVQRCRASKDCSVLRQALHLRQEKLQYRTQCCWLFKHSEPFWSSSCMRRCAQDELRKMNKYASASKASTLIDCLM